MQPLDCYLYFVHAALCELARHSKQVTVYTTVARRVQTLRHVWACRTNNTSPCTHARYTHGHIHVQACLGVHTRAVKLRRVHPENSRDEQDQTIITITCTPSTQQHTYLQLSIVQHYAVWMMKCMAKCALHACKPSLTTDLARFYACCQTMPCLSPPLATQLAAQFQPPAGINKEAQQSSEVHQPIAIVNQGTCTHPVRQQHRSADPSIESCHALDCTLLQ